VSATPDLIKLTLPIFFAHMIFVAAAMGQPHDAPYATTPFADTPYFLNERPGPPVVLPTTLPSRFDDGTGLVLLPQGVIYPAYLAGSKESRMGAQIFNRRHDGALFDATLGSRLGLFRIGPRDEPLGFQMDIEGSAQLRLDPDDEVDVRSVDFRAGIPFSYGWQNGWGNQQIKFGYYHLSSHLGDEFVKKNPGFDRLNFARDVLILGYSIYPTERLRLYGETGWAFWSDVTDHWEFQFGLEYAPTRPTGFRGEPFFAINGHLREEVNFGGGLTVQTGWAWRGDGPNGRLLRMGLHYYNGESPQFSFFDHFEQQIGFGVWYDL